MKLYSYQRWSSAVQEAGTTKARQEDAARAYALKNGLEYCEIVDSGVSAFRGANKQGALGKFIDAVQKGVIERGVTLYVESLDRISREGINNALRLFQDILELDITIVTGMDGKVFTKQSINDNPFDLMMSILVFIRANEESTKKSLRTNGNALALVERAKAGLPTNIKSMGGCPFWIDNSMSQYEAVRKDVKYWPIAEEIVQQFLDGKSVFQVVKYLNATYPEGCYGKPWNYANVRKVRLSKAIYGVKEITINGDRKIIENYYPALCTEGEFLRLQVIKDNNKYIGKVGDQKNNINLLCGMKLFRCGHCGSTMMAMKHKNTIRYMCEKGRMDSNGCRLWSFGSLGIEHCLMLVLTYAYIDTNRKGVQNKTDYSTRIASKNEAIVEISKRITNTVELVSMGLSNVEEVKVHLQDLDKQRTVLKTELDVLMTQQALSNSIDFETLMHDFFTHAQYAVLQSVDHKYREELRKVVFAMMDSVIAWKYGKNLYFSFRIKDHDEYFNFIPGGTKNTYRLFIGGLPFNDNEQDEPMHVEGVERLTGLYTQLVEGQVKVIKMAEEMLEVVGYPVLDGKHFWTKK
ncbi:recombinase family protein [Serratia sp. IR-2025]